MTRACLLAHRYADIDLMDPVARGNALSYPKASRIEYAVHGKFGRTEDDKNGTWGCWYVPLRKLYEAFK